MIPIPPQEPAKKKKKKADKVRSAWISFIGRILAQVIGAAASVVFGIFILQRYQSSNHESKNAFAAPATAHPAPVRARRNPGETAIAVLPLANFSGDGKQEYFVDGLTEALTASLAQVKSMRVISRTSSMAYKGGHKPLPEIARELNVDMLVEGSVTRDGDRVRVTAQLIDGATDEHLWARSFDRRVKDVLALQDEIARANIAKGTPDAAARANAVLAELSAQRPRPSAALARWYAATGNRDRALDALDELVARNPSGLQPLKNDPLLDSVRSDPRFDALLRRAAARLESRS